MAAETQLISNVAGTHIGHLVTHLAQRYRANSWLRAWVQGSHWAWGADFNTHRAAGHQLMQPIS